MRILFILLKGTAPEAEKRIRSFVETVTKLPVDRCHKFAKRPCLEVIVADQDTDRVWDALKKSSKLLLKKSIKVLIA